MIDEEMDRENQRFNFEEILTKSRIFSAAAEHDSQLS